MLTDRPGAGDACRMAYSAASYFSELPTSVNTVLTFVPTVWTAVMIATAMRLAIRAYSIAVAPSSFRMNLLTRFICHYSSLIPRRPRFEADARRPDAQTSVAGN